MERCEEKARRTSQDGRVGQEGKSSRELFQMRVAVIGFGMMGRQIAQVFAKQESIAPQSALLASNTSTLTVSKIGSRLSKKDRLVGLHFFNPAQITKLVEIVKTDQTSERTIQEAAKIVEMIGKTPIIAHDEPGFIANRLGLTLYMEASALLEEGTTKIRDIDLAMKLGYNHP